MTDDPADLAAELIEARIADYRRSMRHALSEFEPLEAIALLGFLFSDTLARFPTDEHDRLLDAFVDGFREREPRLWHSCIRRGKQWHTPRLLDKMRRHWASAKRRH